MAYQFRTLPVVRYAICDDDENVNVENDFDSACTLLEKLRDENPGMDYTLYAEIDA